MKEYYISIRGKTNIEAPLKKGHSYSMAFKEIEITGIGEGTNSKGEDTFNFKGISTSTVTIIGEQEVIKSIPKKGSRSQQLYMAIREVWKQEGDGDYEDWYDRRMLEIIKDENNKLIL